MAHAPAHALSVGCWLGQERGRCAHVKVSVNFLKALTAPSGDRRAATAVVESLLEMGHGTLRLFASGCCQPAPVFPPRRVGVPSWMRAGVLRKRLLLFPLGPAAGVGFCRTWPGWNGQPRCLEDLLPRPKAPAEKMSPSATFSMTHGPLEAAANVFSPRMLRTSVP